MAIPIKHLKIKFTNHYSREHFIDRRAHFIAVGVEWCASDFGWARMFEIVILNFGIRISNNRPRHEKSKMLYIITGTEDEFKFYCKREKLIKGIDVWPVLSIADMHGWNPKEVLFFGPHTRASKMLFDHITKSHGIPVREVK